MLWRVRYVFFLRTFECMVFLGIVLTLLQMLRYQLRRRRRLREWISINKKRNIGKGKKEGDEVIRAKSKVKVTWA